jgi:hypothetical protein
MFGLHWLEGRDLEAEAAQRERQEAFLLICWRQGYANYREGA